MLRLFVVSTSLTAAYAFTCNATEDAKSDCSGEDLLDVCFYYSADGKESAGCLEEKHSKHIDTSEPACNEDACWCLKADCNTKEWFTEFKKTYVPPPMCWSGIAGSNQGPKCSTTKIYDDNEYETPSCHGRSVSNKCVENNKGIGMGDGCDEHTDQSSCEGYQPDDRDKRDLDESFDGTDKHCRWIPPRTKDEKTTACEVDDGCKFYADRGEVIDDVQQGNCEESDSSRTKKEAWEKQRGKGCEDRMKFGCFENNDWMGEAERCTKHKDQDACLAQEDSCSEGECSGTASSGTACGERGSEGECTSSESGCSWKKQCCQWIAAPEDKQDTCLNSGKGTLDGVCAYNDGQGPPSKELVGAGFEHMMFQKSEKFKNKCALVASFIDKRGSAVVLGADKADLIHLTCKDKSEAWKELSEHVGHTPATIEDYCKKFVPDDSAMAALKAHSPAFIIKKAKEGQFGAVMPGLKDVMFIVTAKPEFGECLFFSKDEVFGAAVCTCDKKECNGKAALELIVDPAIGPMRLLQFIDGSLSSMKDEVNGVVSGLLNDNGKINAAQVGKVTEAHVNDIMKLEGMSDKTTKAELWGIVQDFQKLSTAQADYKEEILKDGALKALKVDADKVGDANKAAGCPLYTDDGVPNTLCLQSLSDEKQKAVADATGIDVSKFEDGKGRAQKHEAGESDDEAGESGDGTPSDSNGTASDGAASDGFALHINAIVAFSAAASTMVLL